MAKNSKTKPETLMARLGGYFDAGSGGVVPPMQPSTTFLRDENYDLVVEQNSYGRDDSDQVRLAEYLLAELDGGKDTILFSTGMAAISALVSYLKRGETLLIQSGIYWGATNWIRRFCEHREIRLFEADAIDLPGFCETMGEALPSLVILEVPSNPWIRVCDVSAIAKAAKEAGSVLAVDATAATPLLLRPLDFGADIVVHSATKAINGHSDVLAGVLTCADSTLPIWEHVKEERAGAGAILSVHGAWLLLRGMRTLPLRVERMASNAQYIAEFLNDEPKVEEVWYPGLDCHRDYEIASRLMPSGSGYLMSFLVKGGREGALEFCRHLQGIHRATSLGGTESLVEHRHTVEGHLTGCPENLIRLSVGIEAVEDLTSELGAALERTKASQP